MNLEDVLETVIKAMAITELTDDDYLDLINFAKGIGDTAWVEEIKSEMVKRAVRNRTKQLHNEMFFGKKGGSLGVDDYTDLLNVAKTLNDLRWTNELRERIGRMVKDKKKKNNY